MYLKAQLLQTVTELSNRFQQLNAQVEATKLNWRAFFLEFAKYSDFLYSQMQITKAYAELGVGTFNAFTTAIARSFQALVLNQGNALKTFVTSLGQALLQVLSQVIAKLIMVKVLQATGLANLFASMLGGASPAVLALVGMANGGILRGGFMPIRAFASGGIVDRPTIGIVGEGKYNEAIVPLPDGKAIPVKFQGQKQQQQPTQIQIINVTDPRLLEDYLLSPAGQQAILNIISDNKNTVLTLLQS
jgi:hypothetical protein